MANLADRFSEYDASHKTLGNKATHFLGIPTIALALLGLGSKVVLVSLPGGIPLDLGILLILALFVVYLRWHVGLAFGIAALLIPLYLLGSLLPALWLWAILAVGVGLQYIGHLLFERNSPAFHQNAVHMLVGPLWVAAQLFRSLGLYRPRYAPE